MSHDVGLLGFVDLQADHMICFYMRDKQIFSWHGSI